MRKEDLVDLSLALYDTMTHNFMNVFQAVVLGPLQKATVKTVGSEYTGAATFATARALSQRTVDGAFIGGPCHTGSLKVAFRTFPPKERSVLAFEGQPHSVDDFDGEIKEGYGAGIKTLLYTGPAIIKRNTWKGPEVSLRKINIHLHKAKRAGEHYDLVVEGLKPGTKMFEMNVPSGEFKGRYAFIRPEGGKYEEGYMLCVPMKDRSIVLPKPSFKLMSVDKLAEIDANPDDYIAEWKPDGGLAVAHIVDDRAIFTSHREQAPAYYDKLPHAEWLTNKSPYLTNRTLFPHVDLDGTVLFVELFHPEGAARVGGILNANADNSVKLQVERGPISVIIWDIAKLNGKDVSKLPYAERRVLIEQLGSQIHRFNPYWSTVPAVKDHFVDFYKKIISDKRGLPWAEGIVLKKGSESEQSGYKIKHRDTYDVIVDEVLEGSGKYKGTAGKLVVRTTARGPQGEVGSLAVPDIQRDWIWEHRDKLSGQVAEIFAQEITKAQVPRAGVFVRWHPTKSDVGLRMYAEGLAGTTGKEAEATMYALKSSAGWRKK